MKRIKVVFIGGLSNGKIVFDYLNMNKYVDLCLTITYQDNFEGARHLSFPCSSNILKTGNANNLITKIKENNPELIIVAGWSEILSDEILNIPILGTIGFHPSKLPFNRGRSVLAWQIEEGYSETALSMFYYSNFPDGGAIIAQEKIIIEDNDYISDVLDKVDIATKNLIFAYFPFIRKGTATSKSQDLCHGNFRRLRGENDSVINWGNNSKVIFNKIRAISHPYPGAIGLVGNLRIKIWKASILPVFQYGNDLIPGSVIANLFDGSIIIKTKDSFIHIIEWEKI
jgi:methionyl-tRNA formyltransferase